MYELFVLSLLMKFPLHAYLISKIANDTLGPWEKVSRGTLSTLLNKLDRTGLIQETDSKEVPFPTERSSKTFEITSKGRERFYELMLDIEKNPGNYQKIFHIKVIFLEFLTYEDQIYLVNHYLKHCQQAIHHIKQQQLEFNQNPEQVEPMKETPFYKTIWSLMVLQKNQWELEKKWCSQLMEQVKNGIKN
ncbi:PadR family transcriptional regulator [Heyndrickxia camelliae]|uniref:Transcription regulator PadR N-terminal domain-containing protein n=1 Tax=Heyndrickxia camelliae TaxID=1707093 RepID=A0A2N3LPI9_9BACI|nr:PadR family transcriptional regulator [Heyndrickxia camelliae]PKR86530.1 hypothetical protein CWO92_00220 [Heyndrickxia camelliae]